MTADGTIALWNGISSSMTQEQNCNFVITCKVLPWHLANDLLLLSVRKFFCNIGLKDTVSTLMFYSNLL